MISVIPPQKQPFTGSNNLSFEQDSLMGIDKQLAAVTQLIHSAKPEVSNYANYPQPAKSLSDFDYLRITKEKDIPNPPPTATINGFGIASPGNITGISAQAKAGKTAFTGVYVAGAISETGQIDGLPDLEVMANPDKKAVIVIDTEQAQIDQQYNINTVLRRSGYDTTPDHLRAYNIRQLSLSNYQQVTTNIIEACATHCGGVHSIVIDGGADFTLSVNDEAASNEVIQYFIHLAIRHACPVLVVIHLNPGSSKERGHFGSSIQRKCYGLLTIEKEGNTSVLTCKMGRKLGDDDTSPIYYQYSKENGYHVGVDAPDREGSRDNANRQKVKDIIEKTISTLGPLRYKEVVSALMIGTGKCERTCKTIIANAEGWGFLVKGSDGNYRR